MTEKCWKEEAGCNLYSETRGASVRRLQLSQDLEVRESDSQRAGKIASEKILKQECPVYKEQQRPPRSVQ